MTPAEPDDLKRDYESKRSSYIAFTRALRQLLVDLLSSAEIDVLTVEGRTKARASLAEKLQREDKVGKYSALEEITDLTGLRIISYLQEDCARISDLIRQNFDVDTSNSVDKTIPDEVDRFGYSSVHFVVSLDGKRAALPELRRFRNLKAEIQVRTVLQHAWAVLDWRFRYKSKHEAPAEVRRKLHRISAFLEGADENFSEVHAKVLELRRSYETAVKSDKFDIELNSESLKTYLVEGKKLNQIYQEFIDSGGVALEDSDEMVGRLVEVLFKIGMRKIEVLDQFLEKCTIDLSNLVEALKGAFEEKGFTPDPLPLAKSAVVRLLLAVSSDDAEFPKKLPIMYPKEAGQEVITLTRERLQARTAK